MYDELVKRLRNCATQAAPCKTCDMTEDGSCSDTLMTQAADAIESMSEAYDKLSRHMDDLAALMPRWIPVTERLPEYDGDFLVWFYDAKCWKVAVFNKHTAKERHVWWFAGIDRTKFVTHWMPLPEPPKEG